MNKHTKKRYNRSLLSCALAACIAMSAPVMAQSTGATLRGQAAAGATVTVTNVDTGLSRTAAVNANGGYNIPGLPPGTYRVEGGAGGTRNITLSVGQVATVDLAQAPAATSDGVTNLERVVATAEFVAETKTSEVATYVSAKQIEALPQASRNFLSFADIVPGVTFSTGNDGSTSLRSGAQQSAAINVFIDGVGQKDYVLKGGTTGQDSSRGNPFPQLGIAEYKVITSNYKAEYDQLSSAGITAVTKSGTNEFHGEVFGDRTTEAWRKPTPAEEQSGSKVESKEEQYGFAIGGPIIRDKMHFFFTYEAKDYTSPRTVTPGRQFQISQLPAQFQDIPIATAAPFEEDLYFGKIDWSLTDDDLLELTMKRREEDEVTNVGGVNSPESATLKTGEETRIDLRWQHTAMDWLNDAHITYEEASFAPRPATLDAGFDLYVPQPGKEGDNSPSMDLILNTGGGGDYQDKGQKGLSLQNDFTWFGWEGHTVKAGVKYKTVELTAFEKNPFSPQFQYDITRSLTVPYRVQFQAPGNGNLTTVVSDVKQLGMYLQDDWQVDDHLTLNYGVRWDYEQNPSYENHVTPQTLVDRLNAYAPLRQPGVDYDINDYISTGRNRESTKGNWQPRLGFSYDISADQRHVIFGGAGRSYGRNQFDYLSYEQYRLAFQVYNYNFSTPGHLCASEPVQSPCIAWDPKYLNPDELNKLIVPGTNFGNEVFLVNNELKTPYSDQFSLGMRNSFGLWGNDWNSSVTLVKVLSKEGILMSIGNRRADGSFFRPGEDFGNSPGADLPGYSRFFLVNNGVESRLDSLLVSLEKPYTTSSGWGTSLAYTYSDAEENRPNADKFTFDYPNLDGVAFFGAAGVPKHKLVATGIYDRWGVTFSSKLTWTSAPGNNGLYCFDRPDPGACNIGGRFETYYFDAQDFFQLDLAAQKEWSVGGGFKLRVRGDVLNVTNQVNYTDFGNFIGVGGAVNTSFGQRTGLGITGPTRTLKLSMGLSW